ncbi:LysM peptidoglycan-binding domain-containing protein [Paraburkholderia sp. WSM4179]|uniref:LysM peptidoglycan-binding domain-containing protein n=1 Tax=unclassified Paraburkholderia TaxID=2615204 RepID=UPI0024761697|nr:LysM peptidoglycan-binding domain-containing protein [Paraburkholderia sp. WSM4179]MDH6148941.1 LysM repeat protein [Paraburkholderia sp. WSM4179]
MSSNLMTDAPEVYVVQPGDTLGGIARTYRTTTHVLAKMNRLQNPDRLAVGQRLVVSEKKVCAVVPLFIDRDRNPIKGLRYRIESRRASAFEGMSQLNGLGERFITKIEGDVVRILVRKLDGTWKLIHETKASIGEKLVTLKSGKIRLPSGWNRIRRRRTACRSAIHHRPPGPSLFRLVRCARPAVTCITQRRTARTRA